MGKFLLTLAFALFLIGCGKSEHLRGKVEQSKDGKTYLVITDDNGGHCGPILVDGKPWSHGIGEAGLIKPGSHKISCETSLSFIVPKGVIFKFNYWGP